MINEVKEMDGSDFRQGAVGVNSLLLGFHCVLEGLVSDSGKSGGGVFWVGFSSCGLVELWTSM